VPDIVRLENEYYVRASSALADDRTRVLKYGDTFAVFNRYGDIESFGPSRFGLFHAESRHLSRFTLRIGEKEPLLLSSNIRDDNAFLSVDLTNLDYDIHGSLPRGIIHTFRLQFLRNAACYQHFRFLNYSLEAARISVAFYFEADFADIFEVRGTERKHRGQPLPDQVEGDAVVLVYQGLDGIERRTRVTFAPRPISLRADEARFEIALKPKEEKEITAVIACELGNIQTPKLVAFAEAYQSLEKEFDHRGLDDCHITTSNENFNAWLTRSAADLHMLTEGNPEGPYPYAGVPWFNTVFGRDGIITALECLWLAPRIAESVLRYLAETQATETIPEQDAEPGKIIHEMRRGEMAATKEVPFGRYYGSVDATPLFVMLAGAYFQRTGNLPFLRQIWPNIQRALEWMDNAGDVDGDGFVEYEKRSANGLVQQGWKDSWDSVFHSDGRIADPPIALCEVQSYVFAAKRSAALIARALDESALAESLEKAAETLRAKFEAAFWCEDLQTYALALDGAKKPCCVRASNAGHALFCRIASPDRASRVAATLMDNHSFGGWGVRTLAATEARYNPMSYHNGSVWPHDNALLALGFSLYGLQKETLQIMTGLYEVSRLVELQRLPELFCGFHKRSGSSGPTLYPVACAPQAWAAGSVFLLLQACLGIHVRAREREICFTKPTLPEGLQEVSITNLKVGDATVDLVARRYDDHAAIEVLRKQGALEVLQSV
jgi:glycogen debranching enzyme